MKNHPTSGRLLNAPMLPDMAAFAALRPYGRWFRGIRHAACLRRERRGRQVGAFLSGSTLPDIVSSGFRSLNGHFQAPGPLSVLWPLLTSQGIFNRAKLPSPDAVDAWSGSDYVSAVEHNQACPQFDPNVRQLLHVGYKVAAEMGDRYLDALKTFEDIIAEGVIENVLNRHIRKIFA